MYDRYSNDEGAMSNYIIYNGELYHHGVKGQRWGVRRFQNPDGSLTAKGIKRISDYRYGANRFRKYDGTFKKQAKLESSRQFKKALNTVEQGVSEEKHYLTKASDKASKVESKRDRVSEKLKTAAAEGKNTDKLTIKLQKMNDRLRTGEAIVKQHKANISRGENLIKQFTAKAEKNGYSVMSQKMVRLSNPHDTDSSIMTGLVIAGPLGGVILGGVTADIDTDSKRYNVRSRYVNKMQYELYHHGILGMRWGIRRFQNKDGTLTTEGRRRLVDGERKRMSKYQRVGKLTAKGEQKAYSPDGTLKPEFANKYYWRKNGELTTPGYDRSSYLKDVAFTNAKYASEHFRGRDSGQKLFDAEKALKEYAFIEKKSYDQVRNEIEELRQRRQQIAMNIAKHALSTNKVYEVDDHELDYVRDHAKTLKTLAGTLDKYVRDIPDTSKQDERVSDILDKYDMMMINRIEQQSEGYRRYVYDE